MAREGYLADTSVFSRLARGPVEAAFAPLAAEGRVAICRPVMFELGFAARNRWDYEALMRLLSAYAIVPTTDGDHRRAIDIQAALVARGQHRAVSFVDALVAATAEAHDLTVLHYDADFELIAGVTGQPEQWIVRRGTAE